MIYRRQLIHMSLAFAASGSLPIMAIAQAKEATETQTPMPMDDCIAICLSCHRTCIETVSEVLGDRTPNQASALIPLLMDCAELCLVTAHSMSRRSPVHKDLCEACAKVCDSCASACETAGGREYLVRCSRACRDCASSCRHMAAMH
jgi:hypothetical protein